MKQMKQELQSTNSHILMMNKLSFSWAKSTDDYYRPHTAHRACAYQGFPSLPTCHRMDWIEYSKIYSCGKFDSEKNISLDLKNWLKAKCEFESHKVDSLPSSANRSNGVYTMPPFTLILGHQCLTQVEILRASAIYRDVFSKQEDGHGLILAVGLNIKRSIYLNPKVQTQKCVGNFYGGKLSPQRYL